MQIRPEDHGVLLEFFPAEAHFLAAILDRIADEYQSSDRSTPAHRGLDGSGYSPEDEEAWWEERRLHASEHARQAREWSALLRNSSGEWVTWRLDPEGVERFILLANDHRMYLAGRYAIGEEDMDSDLDAFHDDGRRMVLLEIHLLAQLIELMLPYAPM
ncbi:MAG: hypothetical protein SFU85_03235 [Candidatus Methylacidiphilales bacterium]|nr:hypothetical protein [Candidatus Methylacidiphilales bacterium]